MKQTATVKHTPGTCTIVLEKHVCKACKSLIAAAPELLKIVNALVDWWDENDGLTGPHAGSLFSDDRTWNDTVHDAIAKAEGRDHA